MEDWKEDAIAMRNKQMTFVNGRLVEYKTHNYDEEYESYWATGGNGSDGLFND